MSNLQIQASQAIERAKNLQEFTVFREMEDIVFCDSPIPYTINHVAGGPAEIRVPAISQLEAECRVDEWLRGQQA